MKKFRVHKHHWTRLSNKRHKNKRILSGKTSRMEVLLVAILGLVVNVFGICRNGELTSSGLSEEHQQKVVDLHNMERNLVAKGGIASQPMAENMLEMKWDRELASAAQRWADGCIFMHDPNRTLPDGRAFGQNIAQVIRTGDSNSTDWEEISNMVKGWFSEVTDYKPNDRSNAGHYSQMVWANSKKLGCGYSQYKRLGGGGITAFVVCNYYPAGNVVGAEPYKAGSRSCESQGLTGSRAFSNLCTVEENEEGNVDQDEQRATSSTESTIPQSTYSTGSALALDVHLDSPQASLSSLQPRLSTTTASSNQPVISLNHSELADSLQPSTSVSPRASTASALPPALPLTGMQSVQQAPQSNHALPFYLIPPPTDLSKFLKYLAVVYMQGEPNQQNLLPQRTILRLIPTSFFGSQLDPYFNLERQNDNSFYYEHLPSQNYQLIGAHGPGLEPSKLHSEVQHPLSNLYPQGSLTPEDIAASRQNDPKRKKIIDGSRILDLSAENGRPIQQEYNVPSLTEGFNLLYKQGDPFIPTGPQPQSYLQRADRSLLDDENPLAQESIPYVFPQAPIVPQGFENYQSKDSLQEQLKRNSLPNFRNDPPGEYPSGFPLKNSGVSDRGAYGLQAPFIGQEGQLTVPQGISPALRPPYNSQGFQQFPPQSNNFYGQPQPLIGSPGNSPIYSSPINFPDTHAPRVRSPLDPDQGYLQSTPIWPENLRGSRQLPPNAPNNMGTFSNVGTSSPDDSEAQKDSVYGAQKSRGLESPYHKGSRDLVDELPGSQFEQEPPKSQSYLPGRLRDDLQSHSGALEGKQGNWPSSFQSPDSLQKSTDVPYDFPNYLLRAQPYSLQGPQFNSPENLQRPRELRSNIMESWGPQPSLFIPVNQGGHLQPSFYHPANLQGLGSVPFTEPAGFPRLPQSQEGLQQYQSPPGFPRNVQGYLDPPSNTFYGQQRVPNSPPGSPDYYQGYPESVISARNPLQHSIRQSVVPHYLQGAPSQSPENVMRYQQLPVTSLEGQEVFRQHLPNNMVSFDESPQSQLGRQGDQEHLQNSALSPQSMPFDNQDIPQDHLKSLFGSPLNFPGSRKAPSNLPHYLQGYPYSPGEKQQYPQSSSSPGYIPSNHRMPSKSENGEVLTSPLVGAVDNKQKQPKSSDFPKYQPGSSNVPYTEPGHVETDVLSQVTSSNNHPLNPSTSELPGHLSTSNDAPFYNVEDNQGHPQMPVLPEYLLGSRNTPSNGPHMLQGHPPSSNFQEYPLGFKVVPHNVPENVQGLPFLRGTTAGKEEMGPNTPTISDYTPASNTPLFAIPDNNQGHQPTADFPRYQLSFGNVPYPSPEKLLETPNSLAASANNNQGYPQFSDSPQNLPSSRDAPSSSQPNRQEQEYAPNYQTEYSQSTKPQYPTGSRNGPSNILEGKNYPQIFSADNNQGRPQTSNLLQDPSGFGEDPSSQLERLQGSHQSPDSQQGYPKIDHFPGYAVVSRNAPTHTFDRGQQQERSDSKVALPSDNQGNPWISDFPENLPVFQLGAPSSQPDSLGEFSQPPNNQPRYLKSTNFPGYPSSSPPNQAASGIKPEIPYPQTFPVDNNQENSQTALSQNHPGFGEGPSAQLNRLGGLRQSPDNQQGFPQKDHFLPYPVGSRNVPSNGFENGQHQRLPNPQIASADENQEQPQTLPQNLPSFQGAPSHQPDTSSMQGFPQSSESPPEYPPSVNLPGFPGSRNVPFNATHIGDSGLPYQQIADNTNINPLISNSPKKLPGSRIAPHFQPESQGLEYSSDNQPVYSQSTEFPGYLAIDRNTPPNVPNNGKQSIPHLQVPSANKNQEYQQFNYSPHNLQGLREAPSSQQDWQGLEHRPANQPSSVFPGYQTGSWDLPSNVLNNRGIQGLPRMQVASEDNSQGHPGMNGFPQNQPGFGEDPSSQLDKQGLAYLSNNQLGYPPSTNIPGYPADERNIPSSASDNERLQGLPYPQVLSADNNQGYSRTSELIQDALVSQPGSLQGVPQSPNNHPEHPHFAENLVYPSESRNTPSTADDLPQKIPLIQSDPTISVSHDATEYQSGSRDAISNDPNRSQENPQSYDFPGYRPGTGNGPSMTPNGFQRSPYAQFNLLNNIQGYHHPTFDSHGNIPPGFSQPSNVRFGGSAIPPSRSEYLPQEMQRNQLGHWPLAVGNERYPFTPGHLASGQQEGNPQLLGNLYPTDIGSPNVLRVFNYPNSPSPDQSHAGHQYISLPFYSLPNNNQRLPYRPSGYPRGLPGGMQGPVPPELYNFPDNLPGILSGISIHRLDGGQWNTKTPLLPSEAIYNPTSQPWFKGSRELLDEEPMGGQQVGNNVGTNDGGIQNPDGQQLVPIGEADLKSLFGGDPQALAVVQKVLRFILPDVSQQLQGGQTTMVPIDLVRILIAIILEFLRVQGIETYQPLNSLLTTNGSVPQHIGSSTRPTGMRSIISAIINDPSPLGNGGRHYTVGYPVIGLKIKPGSMDPQIPGYSVPFPLRIPMNVHGLNAYLTRLQIHPISGVLQAEINPGSSAPVRWTVNGRGYPFNLNYLPSNPPSQADMETPESEMTSLPYNQLSQQAYLSRGERGMLDKQMTHENPAIGQTDVDQLSKESGTKMAPPFWGTGPLSVDKTINEALVRDYSKNQEAGGGLSESRGQSIPMGGRQMQNANSTESSMSYQKPTIIQYQSTIAPEGQPPSLLGSFHGSSANDSRTESEMLTKSLEVDASASAHPASSFTLVSNSLPVMQDEEPHAGLGSSQVTTPMPGLQYLRQLKVNPPLFKNAHEQPVDAAQLISAPANDSKMPVSSVEGNVTSFQTPENIGRGSQSVPLGQVSIPSLQTSPRTIGNDQYLPNSEFATSYSAQAQPFNPIESQIVLGTPAVAVGSMQGGHEGSQTEPNKTFVSMPVPIDTVQSHDVLEEGQRSFTQPEYLSHGSQSFPLDQVGAIPESQFQPGREENKLQSSIPILSTDGHLGFESSLTFSSPSTSAQNELRNSEFLETQKLFKHYKRQQPATLLPTSQEIQSFGHTSPSELGDEPANFQSTPAVMSQGILLDQVGSKPEGQILPGMPMLPQISPLPSGIEQLTHSLGTGFLQLPGDPQGGLGGSQDPQKQSMQFLQDHRHMNPSNVPSSDIPEAHNSAVQNPYLFRHFRRLSEPGSQPADTADPGLYGQAERQMRPWTPQEASSGSVELLRNQPLELRGQLVGGSISVQEDLGSTLIPPADKHRYKAVGSRIFKNYGGIQEAQSNDRNQVNAEGGWRLQSTSAAQGFPEVQDQQAHILPQTNGFSTGDIPVIEGYRISPYQQAVISSDIGGPIQPTQVPDPRLEWATAAARNGQSDQRWSELRESQVLNNRHEANQGGSTQIQDQPKLVNAQRENLPSNPNSQSEKYKIQPTMMAGQLVLQPQHYQIQPTMVTGQSVQQPQQYQIQPNMMAGQQPQQYQVQPTMTSIQSGQQPQQYHIQPNMMAGQSGQQPQQYQIQPTMMAGQSGQQPQQYQIQPNMMAGQLVQQHQQYQIQPSMMASQSGQQPQKYVAYRVPAGQRLMSVQKGPTGQTLTTIVPRVVGPTSNFQPYPQYVKVD